MSLSRWETEAAERRDMHVGNDLGDHNHQLRSSDQWPVVDDPSGRKPQRTATRCMHRVPKPGVSGFGVCWKSLVDGRCPDHGAATKNNDGGPR